ncbi:histidine kinase [Wenzhouxiangella sp. XN79A]|uniref:sensor histidine kinase n=1 Tax=Wenzhouxiangella sp. XN79A TaxID=2724193 RepID=UPI00144ABEC2|nr:histidine kinase [Wenzhouxiangella sp. XN79A]NKI35231.1 histidine kinase [Wenzhouxiangella sp. XN79A]
MNERAERAPPLPDFCQPQAVLLVVLLGLLLALLLTLAGTGFSTFWLRLGIHAVFIEGVALFACLLLCTARSVLSTLPDAVAYLAIFVVIQLIVVAASLLGIALSPTMIVISDESPGLLVLRNVLIASIASLVFLRFLILHRQWQRQVQAEASARLAALQARIRPHFLFNALNTIASLIGTRPQQAEEAVLDLSDLLRSGLTESSEHRLERELELVRGYLRIEALRLGERLTVDWRIADDAPLQARLPALLIQPLVENAVVHGISRLPDGGRLTVIVDAPRRRHWRVIIENPVASERPVRADQGHRMALENVRKRLALAFGDEGRCRVDADEARFRIELNGPVVD